MKYCVCGEPLKYVFGFDGCGDLRCISCGCTSGYCGSEYEATMEFERIYKCDTRKCGNGGEIDV